MDLVFDDVEVSFGDVGYVVVFLDDVECVFSDFLFCHLFVHDVFAEFVLVFLDDALQFVLSCEVSE